ncbi:3'-5' exoribonuclease YhaM family protein [Bulleidia sp. zg-1006]|uniref:3'-5' exoribonuclease YhaM family protein n=1 Tax=Bulleidia sp. zg-1006 TaxID=2806552 RepID=UPI001939ED4D|nr:HD domain-containing protein [Bulleidia sp. zg-1006]QRG86138.1 HD domain-containing protein [Bulleidia sp. zg-1006]
MPKISEYVVGERYQLPLLVKDVKNGMTNKGAPYLSMILADSSGSLEGKMWDVRQEDIKLIQNGRLIQFTFDVLDYKGQMQGRILSAGKAGENVVVEDFVLSSLIPEEKRKEEVRSYIDQISSPVLKKLVIAMFQKVGQRYFDYPAASKIHHAFLGGLSEHSLSMVKTCLALCDLYPQLNKDLLISGALVHDMGKTEEMSGPITTEYTLQGRLEGHISLANGWLSEVAKELSLEEEEETILLHHMILSHHGHLEYGSPVLPCLQEAEILSLVDNIDAHLNTLKLALKEVEPGSWTSRLFSMENRQFYKPKEK